MIDVALQLVLVVLLLLTITWCVVVHQRLRHLRTESGEMRAFITALGEATARAERSLELVREAGREVDALAHEQERRAHDCGDELARLIERAERAALRLEPQPEPAEALATRTLPAASPRAEPPSSRPAARRPAAPADRSARTTAAADAAAPARAAPRQEEPGRSGARARAPEARLDGLLHGELLEALKALR